MGLTLITAPTDEPLDLEEVKLHLRLDTTDDDDWVDRNIQAARQYVETETRRALLPQTWDFSIDYAWPVDERQKAVSDRYPYAYNSQYCRPLITLPKPPVQSVASVYYYDIDGNQTLLPTDQYYVSLTEMEGRIEPAYLTVWPYVQPRLGTIVVRFTCGYSEVPEPMRSAMLLLIGHWFENRNAVGSNTLAALPMAVDSLLFPYRVFY